jgi:hypothetical protein
MTPRRERAAFVAAVLGLWLVFVVQAVSSPVLLDDWFQLRYWRDHSFTWSAIWHYGVHNYFHYNPRIGDVWLAVIDGSRAVHLVVTPIVQLAAVATAFVIALGRWPRCCLRDLQLLLFVQVMIWLVVPIPGIIYFYRPIATNYLWAFTLTLALFVPYRLALAGLAGPRRTWLSPIMLVLGWIAGMCNEHTGPAAMIAMVALLYVAWRRRQLCAWMVAGAVGLYVGYPMLFFAPGQALRYGGLATRETPARLLAERGVTGCLHIVVDFVWESRLGILLFAAVLVRHLVVAGMPEIGRTAQRTAGLLALASLAIVVTLFMSPTTTDRVMYASGVLLVTAFTVYTEALFAQPAVRRIAVAACALLFGYLVVRFLTIYAAVKAENDDRIAMLRAATPGTVLRVPPYAHQLRSRWHLGDDFQLYPWLGEYVARELFDLANLDVEGMPTRSSVRYEVDRTFDPPIDADLAPAISEIPTYRQWQRDFMSRVQITGEIAHAPQLSRLRIELVGLPFPDRRPIIVVEWTPRGETFFDGWPQDDEQGHFIHVTTLPRAVESTFVSGCGTTLRVEPIADGDHWRIPVDERLCRGVFTAVACEPARCWMVGWY